MTSELTLATPHILVVDDEPTVRQMLRALMEDARYRVSEADTIAAASHILREHEVDLAIVDRRLSGEDGVDLIRVLKHSYPNTESILLTAFGSIENSVEAMQAGAGDYLTKPFANHELSLRVSKALERKRLKEELLTLRQHVAMSYGFDNIVGISKKLTQVKETAQRISPTDITILITGPSGTGKELFARAVHHHSRRRTDPFIAIDCSAIPETLLESELFGHTKGSFTSATQNKTGLLEQADGGTVFLDEVSNMPMSIQVKLLRFLQDSVIRQIGSAVSRKVDVRIVAATNRDLAEMVKDSTFREDLYYRLNVIPLTLPPLVERAEDIEILTEYFMRKIATELGRQPLSITREAVDKLLTHSWPGNVRELENTLKRGAALCTTDRLTAKDIMFIASDSSASTNDALPARTTLKLKGNLLDSSQRSLIVRALNDNNWNYTKTASELGIGRTTLWRKIKKYDLKQETVGA